MAIIMPYKSAAPKIDESVYLAPTAVVTGDVTIEEGTSIWFGAVVRGDFQPIKIGKNTNIQENATIHVMHDHPTTIGEGVSIGHNAVIHSKSIGDHTLIGPGCRICTPQHPIDFEERRKPVETGLPITIGEDCWLGAGVTVCPGVRIGARSIIGAGSVVVHDIPEDSLAAGNPAVVKRKLR